MEQMISVPESLYLRLVDYFDDKSDADGNSEGYTPNEEMKLLTELEACVKENIIDARTPEKMFYDNGLELILTCGACPEQYDVFLIGTDAFLNGTGKQVGYFRLRHGCFRVDFPVCGGETIYYTEDCSGDGIFDDSERMKFLTKAMNAILKKINTK